MFAFTLLLQFNFPYKCQTTKNDHEVRQMLEEMNKKYFNRSYYEGDKGL